MSGNGAYDDEMDFLNRPNPEEGELAAFAQSLRATLVSSPPPGDRAAMAIRLAEEARIARAEHPTATVRVARPRRTLRLAAEAAVAVALVPLAGAGLAVAGVNLPGPAQSAFEKVGIELPNQADPQGDEPAAPPAGQGDASDGGDATPVPSDPDPKADGANRQGKDMGDNKGKSTGKPPNAGGQPGPSNGNANGNANGKTKGNSGQAPGQGGSPGNAGGNGMGKAVGKTGATPPGQAKKPVPPGNSGTATGKTK
jgi:hypothetical protein